MPPTLTSANIYDEAALDTIYGTVNPNSLAKETNHLTAAYRNWIEQAPFMAVASGGNGGMDCSPRGDKPGQLFRVLDNKTIAIPDRRGNNRLDTLRNLVTDPRIALLFLMPGVNETLTHSYWDGKKTACINTAFRKIKIRTEYSTCACVQTHSSNNSRRTLINVSREPAALHWSLPMDPLRMSAHHAYVMQL